MKASGGVWSAGSAYPPEGVEPTESASGSALTYGYPVSLPVISRTLRRSVQSKVSGARSRGSEKHAEENAGGTGKSARRDAGDVMGAPALGNRRMRCPKVDDGVAVAHRERPEQSA